MYVQEKVAQGWSHDVIIGRGEFPIDCSARTLYRRFKKGLLQNYSCTEQSLSTPVQRIWSS